MCPLGWGVGGSCCTGKDQKGRSWEEEEEEKVGGERSGMSDRSVVFGYRTAWDNRREGEEKLPGSRSPLRMRRTQQQLP